MRIEEERITLKDGRNLTLRSAEERDAQTMLDYIVKTAEETHFLIRYPEEINMDLEREKNIINENLEADDSVWFTVFDGDNAVGNCSIARHRNHIKLKHRCDFAIAIEQAYCGCGLGTLLMKKAIDKAKELAEKAGVIENMTFVKGALEDLSAFPALKAMTLHGNPFSQEEKERLKSLYPEIHFGFESGEADG